MRTDWTSTVGVALVAAVLLSLLLLASFAVGSVSAQEEVDISLQPSEGEVEPGEETTVAVVVEGPTSGIATYDITVDVSDPAVATITELTLTDEPGLPHAEITDDGATAELIAAMLGEPHPGDDEITIAELTVQGVTDGETMLNIRDEIILTDSDNAPYVIGDLSGMRLDVGESAANGDDTDDEHQNGVADGTNGDGTTDDDGATDTDRTDDGATDDDTTDDGTDDTVPDTGDDDGFGPGFGVIVAITTLCVAGYLGWRERTQ